MLEELQISLDVLNLKIIAEIMVKTNMNTSYRLVYHLIELTLILPVATTSVERIFSAMSIIKTFA